MIIHIVEGLRCKHSSLGPMLSGVRSRMWAQGGTDDPKTLNCLGRLCALSREAIFFHVLHRYMTEALPWTSASEHCK